MRRIDLCEIAGYGILCFDWRGQTKRKGRYMRLISILSLVWMIVGCAASTPTARVVEVPLPTLAPTSTPSIDLQDAERLAVLFLEAWKAQDFDAMYDLISFGSQEAAPRADFIALYRGVQNEMTMASLDYQLRTIRRMNTAQVSLYYDVTFDTNILGQFSDTNRTLHLVLDAHYGDWRVAWSLADLFAEMGSGAVLRFESRIPSRANIYDRNGAVLADMNGLYVTVRVIPEAVPDYAACVPVLAEALEADEAFVENRFAQSGANWIINMGSIERARYRDYVEALETACAASFEQQAVRRYLPTGSLMPHVVGNVGLPDEDEVDDLIRQGFNAETIIGKSGVERSWDETLRGKPGGRLSLFAPDGRLLRQLAEASSQIPQSLWLTIDADLQEYVLRSIGEAYVDAAEFWGGRSPGAAAVVIEVNTGEILALASWPTYDANAYTPFPAIGREVAADIRADVADDVRVPLLNRPTLGVYQVGSTFKVITGMAILDSGIWDENTRYYSSGVWRRGNDVRTDWLAGGHGSVTVSGAITVSCNSCFYEAGYLMNEADPYLLPEYARRFGLGAVTGLGALAEDPGNVPDPAWIADNSPIPWSYSNAVNLSIGQGEVEITPLQMARLYAGIANGGTLYRPQLVRETGILDQRTFVAQPEATGTFGVTPTAIREIQEGMCRVTRESYGTAEWIYRNSPLQELGVCGKTGTAQAPGAQEPHAWFAAYAPAINPEIAVVMLVENGGQGSEVASPIVRRIMEYYFFLSED